MLTPVAMVPLAKGARLSLQAIQHHFIASWPRLPRPMNASKSEQVLAFDVGGSTVSFRVVSSAIPSTDFVRACRESWFWPGATAKLLDHAGHVVVTVDSKETRLNQIKFLSLAVTALLISTPQAMGVYWCAGNIVVSPEMFREFCLQMLPDSLPLYIWVDFRVSKNAQGRSMGFTHGLAQFGLMDMETLNSPEELEELRERLFSLAVYLIENGLIVKNGDTIGDEDQEKITVVYGDSSFGQAKRVMRLDYQSLEKSIRKR